MTGRETDVPNCKAGSCLALSVTHSNCDMETRKRALPRGGKQRCRHFTTKNPDDFERTVLRHLRLKRKKPLTSTWRTELNFYVEDFMNCIRLLLVCVKLKNCFKNPIMQSILLAECYFWKYQTFVHKPFFWTSLSLSDKNISKENNASFKTEKKEYDVVQAWAGQHRYCRCIWSDRCTFVLFSLKLFRVSGYRFFYRAEGRNTVRNVPPHHDTDG